MRILVSGWIGSTNLGDELVLAGVRRLLHDRFGPDLALTAVSIDPAATRRTHGITGIDHRRIDLVAQAARQADLVVFGGGGLVQDETSPFNLPYHLSRPWLARMGSTPVVAIGLGIGPVTTRLGRRLAGELRRFDAVTVRDAPSAVLAEQLGIGVTLGADTALHLAERPGDPMSVSDLPPAVSPASDGGEAALDGEVIAVSLRPWSSERSRLPVQLRAGGSEPAWFVPTIAAALDRVVQHSGLPIRMVALQTDRDHELHGRVAAAMRHPAQLVTPTLSSVLREVGRARLVVALRYHAGIAATIATKPSVLIGYSPKVDALADTLGAGARRLAFDREQLAALDEQVIDLLASTDALGAVARARAELLARRQANLDALAAVS